MDGPKPKSDFKYDFTIDLENENHPLTKIYNMIPAGSRVLDFGCSTGYFAKALRNKNCSVMGIEINESAAEIASRFCDRVIIADLNRINLNSELGSDVFDAMVFADILEHLVDPQKLLVQARNHLKSEGMILCSIPNIAHWSIRLELLAGRFDYQELGLLDESHLRFFTKKSIVYELERSGYFLEQIDRVVQGLDENKLSAFPDGLKDYLRAWLVNDVEHDTFQYVIKARLATEQNRLADLAATVKRLESELEKASSEIRAKENEIERLNNQVTALMQKKRHLGTLINRLSNKLFKR